jgi:hypothetical protein
MIAAMLPAGWNEAKVSMPNLGEIANISLALSVPEIT